MCRAGRNLIKTPYMTIYLVISLPKIRRTYIYMVLAKSYKCGQPCISDKRLLLVLPVHLPVHNVFCILYR
jgi:hypothetical protein